MPISPITLDKLEPVTIKHMENKLIDRIVHEIKGAEIQRDNKKRNDENGSFNQDKQEKAAQEFGYILSKFKMKFNYKIYKNKVHISIKDKDDNLLIETEIDDIETLLSRLDRDTGSIIDMRG